MLVGNTSQSISWWNSMSSTSDDNEMIGSNVIKTGVNKQCTKQAPDSKMANLSKEVEFNIDIIGVLIVM